MLRLVRAILVTGILWGFVWLSVGAAVGFVQYQRGGLIDLLPPPPGFMLATITRFMLEWGLLGAINGALFAVLLAIAERGRTVATLSMRRVALWGAVGTLILPAFVLLVGVLLFGSSGLFVKVVPMLSILVLGAGCAATMFLMARRASDVADHRAPGSLTSA